MENFLALPNKRQFTIIAAALAVFERNGYKKGSTADVAAATGISKALVFHYFGTKKEMYLFLCEHCFKQMQKALGNVKEEAGEDFFDRVKHSMERKIELLRESPHMLGFLTGMYAESDPEVSEDLYRYRKMIAPFQKQLVVEEGDAIKFKPGISPETVLQMLTWMGVGCADEMSGCTAEEDISTGFTAFSECLNILKNNFYKEEYL